MDRPDRIRNNRVWAERLEISPCEPTTNTISQENPSTTMVRRAVARVELMCSIPIFANTAVIPAKNADPSANKIQIIYIPRFPRQLRPAITIILHPAVPFRKKRPASF